MRTSFYTFVITVRPRQMKHIFHFPVDMLRYDVCVPYRSEDASNITSNNPEPDTQIQLFHFSTTKKLTLAKDRWLSFGWEVIDSREV